MNKLGFYTESFGVAGVADAIRKVKPPTLLTHMTDIGALREIRGGWSPDTFVVGRPFVFDPGQQDAMLDSPDPAGEGRKLVERILREFPMATELVNGRLLVDAWMALNEAVPGPASDIFHKNPDLIARRAMAYDAFEAAFQNRLLEHGLQAVAFSFGAGNWPRGDDYMKYFPKTLASHTYLGFHEYGWPHMNPDEPGASSGCGMYRQVMPAIRAQYPNKHKAIITEAGLARMYLHGEVHPNDNRPPAQRKADVGWLYPWDSVSEEAYKDSLRWYNGCLLEDDYVLGACLFQVGPGGDWVTFRHTGQDNQGRPLTLMDELYAIAQEPAPKKTITPVKPEPPELTLLETLRAVGQPLIIPLNPDAMLYKIARQNDLGERLTGEYEVTYQEQTYIAQLYERGLTYVPAGQWDQAQVAPNPRAGEVAAPSELAWTHHITGFLGNRWTYWDQELRDKIPGLTWPIFAAEALTHNPQLETDNFILRAAKVYVMPLVEGQVAAPATQPAVITAKGHEVVSPPGLVQITGGKFCIQGKPQRFIGVNIRGLAHYGHDPAYFPFAPIEHRSQQLQAARGINARLVRLFLAHRDATPEQIAGRLGEVLALVKQDYPEVYLLPALTNLYEDVPFYVQGDEKFYEVPPGGSRKILNHAFYAGGYKENYLPFVEYIVKAFKDEPRIFAWEIGNELKAENEPQVFVDFNLAVAAAIKSWDPYHLVTTGMISTRHAWMAARPDLRQALYGSPRLDFITLHAYNGNEDLAAIEDDSDLARQFGKPFIIEEAGFDITRHEYSDCRPAKTRGDMANWFRQGARCYMPWGFLATSDNNDGDTNVGMMSSWHPDYPQLYRLLQQCGYLLLNSSVLEDVSPAIAGIDFTPGRGMVPPPPALPGVPPPAPTLPGPPFPAPVLPWPLVADGFDFPVGAPDGRGYYVAADLVNRAYYVEHQAWHTGEDWNRALGPGDSPDVDLGDPVYAVAHGLVLASRAFPIWGNVVLIEHRLPSGQTVWSQYAHLGQRLVSKGDVVRRGARIGTIGKGDADRYPAHLHFEIRLKKLPASKLGWKRPDDQDKVLAAYAHPTNFINAYRPRTR